MGYFGGLYINGLYFEEDISGLYYDGCRPFFVDIIYDFILELLHLYLGNGF